MSVATLERSVELYTEENTWYKEFSSPLIAPLGSDIVEVDLGIVEGNNGVYGGKLVQFKISGLSTNFNASLFDRVNIIPPADYSTDHEFYRMINGNLVWDDDYVAAYWVNADSPQTTKIYLYVNNLDVVNTITPSFTLIFQPSLNVQKVWHNLL
jgi:hypothetical protein